MNRTSLAALSLLAVFTFAGCATTTVVSGDSLPQGERIARPNQILVYDFAATPGDIHQMDPDVAQNGEPMQQSQQDMETGRQLGALVARKLVEEINDLGMNAVLGNQAQLRLNDCILRGYFESIDTGNATERVMLGFGSGAADLRTTVIAYQAQEHGIVRLGSREIDSEGGKAPGLALTIGIAAVTHNPIGLLVSGAAHVATEESGSSTIEGAAERTAKEIGEQLKVGFQKQGWID